MLLLLFFLFLLLLLYYIIYIYLKMCFAGDMRKSLPSIVLSLSLFLAPNSLKFDEILNLY